MKTLPQRYPDNLDAATLYNDALMNLRPWQLWTAAGQPAENTLEISAVLQGVLRRDPNHPGANHYYIHAVEASPPHPERALPGADHLVHMPSHIYARLGEFERSALVNENAPAADRLYLARSRAQSMYPLGYYSHNLHFVAYSRMVQGSYRAAAFAGLGRPNDAAAKRAGMDALARDIPADAVAMLNPARQILTLASVDLAARIPQSRNDNARKLRYPRKAVELEDSLAYMQPPDWHYPTREPLGAALLRAGRAGEAEKVFRKDLERNPHNGTSLHGLKGALRVQGRGESLAFVDRELQSAWQYADTKLP
ncbi:MAG: hypothetical protein NTX13_24415 [Acidobacteria bacterium]|jgi:hypothetical protein|nr:hypothetical protein [Acidobacteriota bacterium]